MDTEAAKWIVSLLLISIGTFALVFPVVRYVVVGWAAKRKDIMDGISPDARACYFEMFSRAEGRTAPSEASKEFERLYVEWYGRRFFGVPGVLLFFTALFAVSAVVFTGLDRLDYHGNPIFRVPDTAMAALAGAYLWVLNDHISRARRLDFSPADVLWAVLRLVIAVPLGYAFAAIAPGGSALFVAFAIGAFPLSDILSIIRRLADKYLGLGLSSSDGTDDIIKLHGINKPIAERLWQEDITSITQIAYCDPVRLAMRSNLTFNFIMDCMNQALAWMYLEDGLNKLRPLSLRGAVEIRNLVEACDDPASKDHKSANDALPELANAVNQSPATFYRTLQEVADDPYTAFLRKVWN
jgi:hypothetical protein